MVLCDTDIFIEALKNNRRAIDMLRQIDFGNISLSAITVMELYFGAVNKREMMKIKHRLQQLSIIHVDQEISVAAMDLIEKYAKSHSLHIPDALIAATAICNEIQLLTCNVKDFKFIKGIDLYCPNN
jgi:tRNA(fMet)-specific endonuclease VapC